MKPLNSQAGITIISLMIGLLLSMLCVLTGLTLYKNLVHVSAETKQYTLHDGRISSVMLSLQKAVQVSGYGIADADATDIVIVATTAKKRLLWRYLDEAGDPICKGIEEEISTEDGDTFHEVRLIAEEANCAADASLSTMAFDTKEGALGRWQIYPGEALATYLTTNIFILNYTIGQAVCSPFGGAEPQQHFYLQVNAPNAAELRGNITSAQNTYDYCLSNFYVAAAP